MQFFLTLAGALFLVAFTTCRGELRAPCAVESQNAGIPRIGQFVPQCTDAGYYSAKQCHASTGFCWCVVPDTGKEIEGTRVRGEPPCTICHTQRSLALRPPGTVGQFVPACDEDGLFRPTQYHASTGYSWCVNRFTGEEIQDTRSERGQDPSVKCESVSAMNAVVMLQQVESKGPCHAKIVEHRGRIGTPGFFTPRCTENGFFKTEQYHGSTGYRWCVNPETGAEVEGTKRGPTEMAPQCGTCFKHIEDKLSRKPILGAHLPKCDETGNYVREQSREGYRWCVNVVTGEVEGEVRQPKDQSPLECAKH